MQDAGAVFPLECNKHTNVFFDCEQSLVKNIAFSIKFCVAKAERCLTMDRQQVASWGCQPVANQNFSCYESLQLQ